jgi:hypothetical protein
MEAKQLLYRAIRELQYIQEMSCGSGLCATSEGKAIIDAGMKILGVPDLGKDEL